MDNDCEMCRHQIPVTGYGEVPTECHTCGKNFDLIDNCAECGIELYGGDECYYIDEKYYCENCIETAHVILDKKEG